MPAGAQHIQGSANNSAQPCSWSQGRDRVSVSQMPSSDHEEQDLLSGADAIWQWWLQGQCWPARAQEEGESTHGSCCSQSALHRYSSCHAWLKRNGAVHKWHAGSCSPALAGEAGVMAGFVKIGIRKKNQNLFSRAEVLSLAEGHREELSCAHTHIYSCSMVYALAGSSY